MVFIILESIFVIGALGSLGYYRKLGREKKLQTIPGAMFDMFVLISIFFPLLYWFSTATKNHQVSQTGGCVLIAVTAILALICLVLDVKTLVRNYRINKKVMEERIKHQH